MTTATPEYFIRDNGEQYVNRYVLLRTHEVKVNDGTTHKSVQYYGCFGWTNSSTIKTEDLPNFEKVSEETADRVKDLIQQ
jgi:hypothetical protein